MVSDDLLFPSIWSPPGAKNIKPVRSYHPVTFKPANLSSSTSSDGFNSSSREHKVDTKSSSKFPCLADILTFSQSKSNSNSKPLEKHQNIEIPNLNQNSLLNKATSRRNSDLSVGSRSNYFWFPNKCGDDARRKSIKHVVSTTGNLCTSVDLLREESESRNIKSFLLRDDRTIDTLSPILQQNDDTDSNFSEDWQNILINESLCKEENKDGGKLNPTNPSNPSTTTSMNWFNSLKFSSQKNNNTSCNTSFYNCYPYIQISSSVRKEEDRKDCGAKKFKTISKQIAGLIENISKDAGDETLWKTNKIVGKKSQNDWTKETSFGSLERNKSEGKEASKCGKPDTSRMFHNSRVEYEMEKHRNQAGFSSSFILNQRLKDDERPGLRWFESDAEVDYCDGRGVQHDDGDDGGYLSSTYGADTIGRRYRSGEIVRRQNPELERILAENKEKKWRQEMKENEARRHHDTLTYKEKSDLLLNRYENVQRPQQNFNKSRIKGKARVMFTFRPQHENELALKKGEIVTLLRRIDKNWYKGEMNGQIGVFPSNYVDVIVSMDEARRIADDREGRAVAVYDFLGRTPLELSLKKGDEVMLIRCIDENWYEGRLRGKQGIFPSSYVDVFKHPSSQTSTPAPDEMNLLSRSSSAFSVGPELPSPWNSDFYESDFEREYLTSPSRHSQDGNVVTHATKQLNEQVQVKNPKYVNESHISIKHSKIKRDLYTPTLSVNNSTGLNKNSKIPQCTFAGAVNLEDVLNQANPGSISAKSSKKHNQQILESDKQNKTCVNFVGLPNSSTQKKFNIIERCCAQYSYEPQNDDELKLRDGDVISIVEKCDDGWYIGLCEKTGLFGTFPGNYVQIVT